MATVFHYFGIACSRLNDLAAEPLASFMPEYHTGLAAFARRFFRDLYARFKQPFALVLDNYQDIPPDCVTHDALQLAIEELPEHGTIIFISRTDPPAAYARARTNGELGFVADTDMRLTPTEAIELVRCRGGIEIADSKIKEFLALTQGWTAGMVLLCTFGRPDHLDRESVTSNFQTIFDYFATEILNKLAAPARYVLLTTALLPVASVAMAREISNVSDAGDVLESLYIDSCFTLRDAQPEPFYQFHPLFRVFLIRRGMAHFSAIELASLKQRAISLLAATGQSEAAIDMAVQEGDHAILETLIRFHAPALALQGRFANLLKWLEPLSDSLLQQYPWLQYWRGIAYQPANALASQRDYTAAFASFRRVGDADGVYRSWSAMIESLRSDLHGDNQRLDPWIALLADLISEYPVFPSPAVECDVAYGMFTALHHRAPHQSALHHWRERALKLALAGPDMAQRALVLKWSIIHDLMRGDHARAAFTMVAFEAVDQASLHDPRIASANNFLKVYYQFRTGDFDAAIQTMDRGLALAFDIGVTAWRFQLLTHGTAAAIAKGDHSLTVSLLKKMAPFAQASAGFAPYSFHVLSAWHAYSIQQDSLAYEHVKQAHAVTLRFNFIHFDGIALYALAQVEFRLGMREQAHAHLTTALAVARKSEGKILEHMCRLVEADFAFSEGRESSGLQALAAALALGRDERYLSFTFWDASMMSRLCARAIAVGIEIGYASDIIASRKLIAPADASPQWPWPVKVVTLDAFVVLLNGKPLEFSRKAPKKLISLLKAIICFGGDDVPESILVDALWSDQEADDAHEALSKALQRLRKLLGEDVLLVQADRVSLNRQKVWIDAWWFEQQAATVTANATAMDTTLSLYKQRFLLSDEDAPWSVVSRERLHVKFLRLVSARAGYLAESGASEAAIALCEQAIGIDALAENLYQCAMAVNMKLGRNAEAALLYRRLRQALSVSLGLEPSLQVQELYRTLRL